MTDGELPASWERVPLAELLNGIETGKSFKCDERPPLPSEVGVVKVSAVSWGEYREQESKTCLDAARVNPALFVQRGDFLFSRSNTIELVGACVIAQQVSLRVMLSDKILRFRFADESMKPWVLHLLRSLQGRAQIEQLASGNQDSMRNIGQERIGQIEVPLPPAAEQARIVEKLDELFTELDAGVAELQAAQKKLAQYRQSLLKAAVEGALTADWRASHPPQESSEALLARILQERRTRWEARQLDKFKAQGKTPPKGWQLKYVEPERSDADTKPSLPAGWTWASVAHVGEVQLGRQRSPDKVGGASPTKYVRAANITETGVNLDDVLAMDFSATELETFALKPGDVLLTEASGSAEHVGRPAIWMGADEVHCFQNTVLRFTGHAVTSRYAYFLFMAQQKLGVFRRVSGGVGINHLSAGKFSALAIPVPPLAEQEQVAKMLSEDFDRLFQQELVIEQLLKFCAAQRQNILRTAFAGQLVPQDPADEPASALLARIRAERAAPTAAPKKARRTRASA